MKKSTKEELKTATLVVVVLMLLILPLLAIFITKNHFYYNCVFSVIGANVNAADVLMICDR
jgi:hypothetical protein